MISIGGYTTQYVGDYHMILTIHELRNPNRRPIGGGLLLQE